MACGIYSITSPSGRVYIGSSINIANRWKVHLWQLQKSVHHCVALQRAFNKYGDALVFAIVEECSRDVLFEREQHYIDNAPRLYNRRLQAAGGRLGLTHTTETRAKIAASNKGLKRSPETGAKLSASRKGKPLPWAHTEETRAKIAAANSRRTLSAESRAKIGAWQHKRNTSGYRGVSMHKRRGKWQAYIDADKRIYLGYFETPTLAYAMRLAYIAYREFA